MGVGRPRGGRCGGGSNNPSGDVGWEWASSSRLVYSLRVEGAFRR